MKDKKELIELIFPETEYREEIFESCYSKFSEEFILSCCLQGERTSQELIKGLKTSYSEMLVQIWTESLTVPARDWIFQFSDQHKAAEIVQERLMLYAKNFLHLIKESAICDDIMQSVLEEIILHIEDAEVMKMVQDAIDKIADEEGDDLFVQTIEANWGSITKSSKSNKFAKWCVDKFGPDFKGDFHDVLQ